MKTEKIDPETGEITVSKKGREGYNNREDLNTDLSREDYYANKPFLRTPYNYDRDAASNETAIDTGTETPTQQQFKDDADINVIVERFGITGQLPEALVMPQSADFTGATDFQTSMNVLRQAQEAFAQLPADVREEFANDPHRFIKFVENPKNRERALELGIINAPPAQAPGAPEGSTKGADRPQASSTTGSQGGGVT